MPAFKHQRDSSWSSLPFTSLDQRDHHVVSTYVQSIQDQKPDCIEQLKENYIASLDTSNVADKAKARAFALVVSDLIAQGWSVRCSDSAVLVKAPRRTVNKKYLDKNVVQAQEQLKRDEQLRKPSVIKFIRSMETKRLFGSEFVSIFSLMRDGRELADKLRTVDDASHLTEVIQPYVQIVETGKICSHTGLRLMDIWRYFRLTWTTQYASVPGRTLMFLVRDKAARHHPVIGIGSLCSAVVQLKKRDEWIGWDTESVLQDLERNPTRKKARWLEHMLDAAISEIYVADLIERSVLTRYRLNVPNHDVVGSLRKLGIIEREKHRRFAQQADYKSSRTRNAKSTKYWRGRARTHLFTSKRALALASLLESKIILKQVFSESGHRQGLVDLVGSASGRKAIRQIIKKIRADKVGIAIADINVCGAIAPYNLLHAGKLVSALATSPRVLGAYREKYSDAVSEIASAMAGKPIIRKSDLVFLGTTSLYGNTSAQYNRMNVPAICYGGPANSTIRYRKLGRSRSYGTSQFSESTIAALVEVVRQSSRGQRVNSIFGEGVNPKMRKVRDGLDVLGLPADDLLMHGRERIIYGVSLVSNLKEYLLGTQSRAKYLLSRKSTEHSPQVSSWWSTRWASKRIHREDVLEAMVQHNLTQPIAHGARVPYDKAISDEQLELDFTEQEQLAVTSD